MTGKKIAVLVLVLVGLVLALAIGIISAPDVSEGPIMMPAVKNASVSPPVGNYTDSFNYSVEVRFYEEALIELQLYDPTKKDWITYKTREYRDTLSWETLRWNWIPSDRAWEGENVSYRFRWNNTKLLYDGQGPYIKEEIAWEFRNAIVRPSSGYYNDKFSYSVSVKLNKEEGITLEVFNISSYNWEVRGEKQYNDRGNWQEMKWENIANIASADSEGLASYRFFFIESGERHESGIYYGPTLKPTIVGPIFKNATVDPDSGHYNTPFSYGVEISTSEDVVLTVYDISLYEWVEKGKGTKTGDRWEWENIRFNKDCAGLASYKFVAGTDESEIFYGPTLKPPIPEEIFKNATVDPSSGYYNTHFTYSVDANTGEDVLLIVYDISIGEWVEKGGGTKTGDKWKWENINFKKDCAGFASYKFVAGTHVSRIYDGPTLKIKSTSSSGGGGGGGSYKPYIRYDNVVVDPSWIVIGVREEKSFNYSVDVDRDVSSLILEIYNSSSREWEKKGKGNESKHKDKWRHEWRVNLTLDKNWEGTSKYRFYPDKQERYASQIFYGPEIKTMEASLAGWKKEIGVAEKPLKEPELTSATVTPSEAGWFKKFTYTAEIKHPDRANMTVVLFVYKPGNNEWKTVPWREDRYNYIIRSSDYDKRDTKNVSWTVEKKDVFDEGDAGERSAFYIWYWDGYNEYNESTEPSKGPDLLVNKEPEFVGVPKLNPFNGSIYTVYEYRFDVNDPENDAVYGFLTIKDPLNEDRFTKKEKGEKGFIRFLVGPEQEIFTEDKLTKTNKGTFTSQYQLVYWDDGMDVKGERKTTPWFVGPHVSKIRIEHNVEPLKPESGKYNDVFEYTVSLKSSEKNTFLLDLIIYDPSNTKDVHRLPRKNLTVDAGTWGYAYWNIKPEVFGPDDFGKTACYTIAWKDKSGIGDIINGSGPYIERAVPLLSRDLPLVPIISMVIVPSVVFLSSLLLVRYNLREVYGWWKKKWLKTK